MIYHCIMQKLKSLQVNPGFIIIIVITGRLLNSLLNASYVPGTVYSLL